MTEERTIRVWDIAVRLFHWSLVTSFAIAWLSAEGWGGLHIWAGYAAAGLIGFRLVWGLLGPRYARFSQFVASPKRAIAYMRDIKDGREARYIGHNPAGAAMIIALLLALLGTSLTGWMSITDAYWGVEWVSQAHEVMASLTLTLVLMHLAGVILASMRHRENLARSMVTGRKRYPDTGDIA
jgi:cytochrome b